MKLSTTFKVQVESLGDAVFVFRKLRRNDALMPPVVEEGESELKRIATQLDFVLKQLVEVYNLERDDGTPYTIDDVRGADFPYVDQCAIVAGFWAGAFPRKADSEKKDSSSVSSVDTSSRSTSPT